MKFEVLLTESAAADLESIYDYIEAHEGVAPAQHVLDRFDEAFASLERLPRSVQSAQCGDGSDTGGSDRKSESEGPNSKSDD